MGKRLNSTQRRGFSTRKKLKNVNINQNPNREIRPRLSVHRTNKQIYAQIIDDVKGVTLAAASSVDKDAGVKNGGNKDAAVAVGKLIAARAKKAGVEKVQFDRGSFVYHGRVQALAEGAREAGLDY